MKVVTMRPMRITLTYCCSAIGCLLMLWAQTIHAETIDDKGDAPVSLPDKSTFADKLAKVLAYHIKNLNDTDPDIRQESCDMLAALDSAQAVSPLIEVLNPERKERINVMLHTHAALVKITGQNFGYKNYSAWSGWWKKNADGFEPGDGHRTRPLGERERDIVVPIRGFSRGQMLFKANRYLEAFECFKEAIGDDMDNPTAYLQVGRCLMRLDRADEAADYFALALNKSAENWEMRWQIGKEYVLNQHWERAKALLKQARVEARRKQNDPGQAAICNDLAIAEFDSGWPEQARQYLKEVRELGYDPNPDFEARVKKGIEGQR